MELQPKLTTTKDILAIVRESAIILAVLFIAFHPAFIANWSKKLDDESKALGATGSETSFAGTKITYTHATDTADSLSSAQKTIKDLQQQVQVLIASSSPKNAEQAKKIEASTTALSSQIQSGLQSAHDQLAQEGLTSGSGTYGIVVSADKTDDQAAFEVSNLKKHNLRDIAVYDRQGFMRTVARFPDAASAKAGMDNIKESGRSGYTINLSKWCPNDSEERTLAGVPVLKCQ